MRVLVAPDRFGPLSALQAAEPIARGWRLHTPDDELLSAPVGDGGPGLTAVLLASDPSARRVPVETTGPDGATVTADLVVREAAEGRTVFVEAAQALSGPASDAVHDVTTATSAGLGTLLAHALELGPRRVVVGVGGSATHDAGAGLLAALAGSDAIALRGGGVGLLGLDARGLAAAIHLAQLRRRWHGVDLVVAAAADRPLLGLHGASADSAEAKGATPEQAQRLERCLGDFAAAALTVLDGAGVADPIGGRPSSTPGTGAGGGVGFALALLGGRYRPGPEVVLEALGVAELIAGADLVVTGQHVFDWQALRGSPVAALAARTLPTGVPLIVLAGSVLVGRREAQAIGVESAYALDPLPTTASAGDLASALAERARRVARTWSR